jgi:hypothetical protein
MALQLTPRCIITQARELLQQSSAILQREHLAIFGGDFLLFASQELPHQWLWMVTAEGVIAKEPSCRSKHTRGVDRLSIGVSAGRTSTTDSVGLVSVRLRSCYSMR